MAHTRYLDIADELAATLTAAPTGSRAPSEHEVMSRFQVGRSAARSAIGELEQRGLVRRIQGAGTFVHHPPTLMVEAGQPTVWQQMIQLGIGTTEVPSMRSGTLPNLAANAIGVPTGSPGIWMTMRLTAFDQVVGRSAVWATGADRPVMAKALRERHSLLRALDHLQVRLHYRWARVTLGPADHELATDLEMPVDRRHWKVEGVVEDKPHQIVAWARTEFRADRINLSLCVGPAPARSDALRTVSAADPHGARRSSDARQIPGIAPPGGAGTFGGATFGVARGGAATSGAATSGAATSGAATSGAATSGAATSGAAATFGATRATGTAAAPAAAGVPFDSEARCASGDR